MASPAGAARELSAPDEVLIVGTGAMACLFAARLAAHDHKVVMLGTWPEGVAALRAHGVRLIDSIGRTRSFPVRATDDPRECAGISTAIVLVKSWQTRQAAGRLRDCLAEDGLALSLQNGLGNLEALASMLGPERAAAGTTTYAATLIAPGIARPLGNGEIALAASSSQRLRELELILGSSSLKVRRVKDLRSLQWAKLVVNSAINPITALEMIPNGRIATCEAIRKKAQKLAMETATVAQSMGISLPFDDPAAYMEQVARRTAENYSSMVQDLQRGAPTEIDAINGAVVKYGEKYGVPTPWNQEMLQAVKARAAHQKPAD